MTLGEAVTELLAVLEDVTWNGYAYIGTSPCVSCAQESPRHDPACPLAAAIGRVEEAMRA